SSASPLRTLSLRRKNCCNCRFARWRVTLTGRKKEKKISPGTLSAHPRFFNAPYATQQKQSKKLKPKI
ncbi:hypothetical protein, partial [Enterobacter hormaechei]